MDRGSPAHAASPMTSCELQRVPRPPGLGGSRRTCRRKGLRVRAMQGLRRRAGMTTSASTALSWAASEAGAPVIASTSSSTQVDTSYVASRAGAPVTTSTTSSTQAGASYQAGLASTPVTTSTTSSTQVDNPYQAGLASVPVTASTSSSARADTSDQAGLASAPVTVSSTQASMSQWLRLAVGRCREERAGLSLRIDMQLVYVCHLGPAEASVQRVERSMRALLPEEGNMNDYIRVAHSLIEASQDSDSEDLSGQREDG